MTIINMAVMRALKADINAALVAIGQKHGLVLSVDGGSFRPASATFKLEIIQPGSAEEQDIKAEYLQARRDWQARARLYGLNVEWLDKTFRSDRGTDFKILGLLPGRTKNCVVAERVDTGKAYVFPPVTISRYLSAVKA